MDQKKIYVRGNSKYPEKVIAALKERGAENPAGLSGRNENHVYFIDHKGDIDFANLTLLAGQLMITHQDWTEIYIQPDYKYKAGDRVLYCGHPRLIEARSVSENGEPTYFLKDIDLSVPEYDLHDLPDIRTFKDIIDRGLFVDGWVLCEDSALEPYYTYPENKTTPEDRNTFRTREQALSTLAMAMISQLMEYYGGWVPLDKGACIIMPSYTDCGFCVEFYGHENGGYTATGGMLRFWTREQAERFYRNNPEVVHAYLMINELDLCHEEDNQ